MSRKTQIITFIVLLALLIFLVWVTVASWVEPIPQEWEKAGIREVEGVLYYPDGMPVRNYEQLGIYLDAQ